MRFAFALAFLGIPVIRCVDRIQAWFSWREVSAVFTNLALTLACIIVPLLVVRTSARVHTLTSVLIGVPHLAFWAVFRKHVTMAVTHV